MSISCQSHCCILHGCKYGNLNNDCPVVYEIVVQDYPCEDCQHEGLETISDILNKVKRIPDSDLDKMVTTLDNLGVTNWLSGKVNEKILHIRLKDYNEIEFIFDDQGKYLFGKLGGNN